jgi:hypothetical protein
MPLTKNLTSKLTKVAVLLAISVMTILGQGQRGAGGGQGQRGGGGQQGQTSNLPTSPTVTPLPTISPEVTGPGTMFPSLMAFHSGIDMARFRYEAKEYFVTGTANGQPYKTRIVIRKPVDNSRFSGLVVAESMHPGGNAWIFHFTGLYTMSSGHIGLEILSGPPATTAPAGPIAHNAERYKDLNVQQGQGPEIIAQVGALIRSQNPANPLAGLTIRKMILGGTSASSAALIAYLPAHMVYRLPDMKPIYDGFLPTSTGATIRQIDVPLIQVPTMTEVTGGQTTSRQDGDAAGDQYRSYEFAGMAHLDTREAEGYYPDPCKQPISRFPMSAYISVALHHLLQWVDKGVVPPRADRIWIDRNTASDGSLMALDEYGNVRGGIRTPYVDVPAGKYGVRNEPASPQIPNPHPWIAVRGDATPAFINQVCGLAGYQIALTPAQLKQLHKDKKTYLSKFEKRLDELTKAGWSLPVYRDMILADAAAVNF